MSKQLCHLVFYDGTCGLCDRIVQFLIREDHKNLFVFAPLKGETASQYLRNLPPEIRFTDSFILIENYRSSYPRVFIMAKGAFRVAWLVGWPWLLIGWLSFFPAWMFDWAYRLVADNREKFFSNDRCVTPPSKDDKRFLS